MLEALKSKGLSVLQSGHDRLRDRLARTPLPTLDLNLAKRHAPHALPLAALLVIAGCSWFNDNSVPAPEANPTQEGKATAPAPGEGETMQNGTASTTPAPEGTATAPVPEGTASTGGTEGTASEGTATGGTATEGTATEGTTQTADAGKAAFPDINSVPNEAPKASIVDLNQAPAGLASDTANSQHTDETLTMPNESAARPEKPVEENAQAASVEPTAPETPPAEPAVTPEAATPPAPEATTTPEATPAPETTPIPAPAPETTPIPAPAPEATPAAPAPAQVASTGVPQPGSTPFEPSGPLYLAPGSLERGTQVASAASVASTPAPSTETEVAATPITPAPAPMPITTTPMPSTAPSSEAVSVDYSALNGLQGGGAAAPAPRAPMMMPVMTATNAQIAGVGQAIGYVYFGNNSSQLSSADRQVLQQVVQLQRIQGGVLRIIGHASQRTGNMDALTQNDVNRRVSLERATAVAQALVGMGVQPMLVQVAAAGDNQTLYSESTPAGEAGNRRAEVYLSQN